MPRHTWSVLPALALAGALVYTACSSSSTESSCGSGTPPSLAGTYSLVSAQFGSSTFNAAQGDSGVLTFTATRYTFSIFAPNPAPPPAKLPVLADSGTYTISGAKCISESSASGLPQFTGTFTLSGTTAGSTFSVSGSAAGQPVSFVATKQ